jgi:hypothetical protein
VQIAEVLGDMYVWRCPKCGWEIEQSFHAYAVACWCEQPPVRMVKVEIETVSTDTASRSIPTASLPSFRGVRGDVDHAPDCADAGKTAVKR